MRAGGAAREWAWGLTLVGVGLIPGCDIIRFMEDSVDFGMNGAI